MGLRKMLENGTKLQKYTSKPIIEIKENKDIEGIIPKTSEKY